MLVKSLDVCKHLLTLHRQTNTTRQHKSFSFKVSMTNIAKKELDTRTFPEIWVYLKIANRILLAIVYLSVVCDPDDCPSLEDVAQCNHLISRYL